MKQIIIDVKTDEGKVPEAIWWNATDNPAEEAQKAKAMMLAFWDGAEKSALRIDLWTKDMNVEEMNLFLYQTLATLADTFERATDNKEVAEDVRAFAHELGHKLEVFGEDHKH